MAQSNFLLLTQQLLWSVNNFCNSKVFAANNKFWCIVVLFSE